MSSPDARPAVYLVHPDRTERARLHAFIAGHGFRVQDFSSAESFFNGGATRPPGCLVFDLEDSPAYDLLARLRDADTGIAAIMLSDGGDVRGAVRAMRSGATSFIEKPYARSMLLREIHRCFK